MQDEPRPSFTEWLAGVRSEAVARGIRQEIVDEALDGVVEPLPIVIERDRTQAEIVVPLETYIARRLTPRNIRAGRQMMARYRDVLDRVGEKYGVPPATIVAIWGIESNYGRFSGVRPTVAALATLAFDPRRSAFFRGELFDALEILNRGDIDVAKMRGSWAGAMGQPQFMPSSYLRYAEDFDGDGRRNIWDSPSDIFASVANYLKGRGWVSDRRWGREVKAVLRGSWSYRVRCAAACGLVPSHEGHDRGAPVEGMAATGRQADGRAHAAVGGSKCVAGVRLVTPLSGLRELRRAARVQLRSRVCPQRRAAC